jgi:hypothetical protein
MGSNTGRTESTVATLGHVERLDLRPLDRWNRDDGELSDAVSPCKRHLLVTMIDQQDADLAAVAGVDQSRPVDHTDAVPAGMSRTRQNQTGKPLRDRYGDTRGHGGALTRWKGQIHSRVKIDRSIADMSSTGNRQFPVETYEVNLHGV